MLKNILILSLLSITLVLCTPIENRFNGSSILDEVPLIDGHNDFPYKIYKEENNILENINFTSNLENVWETSQTDLPRLRKGKVGGQFWAAYVPCGTNYKDAVEQTLEQIDVIKRLVNAYPRDLTFVTTSIGILRAFSHRKIASMIGVEGGHSIDSRLSVLRLYYELGVRYLTLTHNCNTPWSENNQMDSQNSSTVKGLTGFGQAVIAEMNRLGMLVDLAHVSKAAMEDALLYSKAPVIFSHSSSYSIFKHTRNVQDDVLLKLRKNGGIIMINFHSGFIAEKNASVDNVIEHLNHIKQFIGPNHIGLGADYDGVSKPFTIGLEDVSKYPVLFDRLAEIGWTKTELRKLAGLNLIRVFREVERVRDRLKNGQPKENRITLNELLNVNATLSCRTDF